MPIPKQLDFPAAIEAITHGEKVSRLDWGDTGIFLLMRDGFLTIRNNEGYHRLMVSDGDMLATDWIVVNGIVDFNSGQKRAVSSANN